MWRPLPCCLACLHVFWLLCCVRTEICVDSHHRITTVEGSRQALNRKEFRREDSGNFTNILLDISNSRLIVGGRNYVFFLSASNLTEVVAIRWKSDQKYDQCIAKGLEQRECENYIQYVGLADDRLVVCGTNSGSPSYNISSVTAPSQAYFSRNMLYGVCATPHPDLRMVGSVTKYGEIIAGTYRDIGGKVGVIAASYLTESMPRVQLSTDRWTKPSLFDPKFVASVDVGDSVYIFFNEQAPELGGMVAPSVARICKTDNGAPQIVSSNLFTTFRKTRLQCTVDEISFSNIDHVAFHEKSQTFYALFSTSSKILPVSAVCAFPRLQFDVVFDGPFLAKSDGQTWKVINNGAFLKGCKVNRANLTSQWRNQPDLDARLPPGKEPTNYLDLVSIVQTIDYQLMSLPLVADLSVVTYVQPLVRLSRIAVESLDVFINGGVQVEEIFYIGTDSGSILVLSKGVASGKPCLIDELRLSDSRLNSERILQILVSSEQGLLFVSTNSRVVSLETRACGRHDSEDVCVQARDPRCGWSASKSSCISAKDRTSDFRQDLSQCPHVNAQWGDWSSWFPCVQEGFSQKYCLCRRRACQSCDPSACSVGGSMEIKNCSVNNITDIDAWKLTGVVDGAFSLWGEWSQCGEGKCGNDFQTRLRTCSNPEPRNGGRECGGANLECRYCHKEPELCLVHWSDWSTWSECTKIREDIYVQTSSRNCSRGTSCQGPMNQTRACSPTGVLFNPWSSCDCDHRLQYRSSMWVAGCAVDNQINCHRTEFRNCSCGNDSTSPDIVDNKVEALRGASRDGVRLTMRDIIIAVCGVVVASFILCAIVVVLLTRRHKRELRLQEEEAKSGISPDLLKTPLRKDPYLNGGSFNYNGLPDEGVAKSATKGKSLSCKRNSKKASNGEVHVELENGQGDTRTSLERPLLHDATKV